MTQHEFYHTKEWHAARQIALKKNGGLCADCFAKGIYKPAKVVHHIEFLNDDNVNDASISLGLDNLIPLCQDCHAQRHEAEKRFKVDELGRVIL